MAQMRQLLILLKAGSAAILSRMHVTEVLDLAKQRQKGRVPEDGTGVTPFLLAPVLHFKQGVFLLEGIVR